MAEWLECWTCNPEVPSSSPALTACWICLRKSEFKSSVTLVNSQLVCLGPVGIHHLAIVMFDLRYLFHAFA